MQSSGPHDGWWICLAGSRPLGYGRGPRGKGLGGTGMVTPRSSGAISYSVSSRGALVATLAVREAGSAGPPKPRLLDRVREAVRARHYSRRTEKTYVAWVRRYILFHGKRHPTEMGAAEVTRFLTSLAAAGGEGGRAPGGHREARDLSHVSALLRHPPPRGQPRHPHRARAPRSPGRQHDPDLHARPQPWTRRGAEPGRPAARPVNMRRRQAGSQTGSGGYPRSE